ncbi:DUF3043 domain-containing protein [Actinoplanes sp. NPDC051411]|uniref:DUF3043 domain-containing protein n=1 Tax=Actinoplanes sp. NPDC051411 TaxID=3155522 RepID=UPI0034253923
MSSLFRRKSSDVTTPDPVEEEVSSPVSRSKSYTPSKKELGQVTPKRASTARRPGGGAPLSGRELREDRRRERTEAMQGMRQGDERYLMARDRGPERRLVRDIVDSRRNIGSYFIVGALIVLIGSITKISIVVLVSNILWFALALLMVLDSVLIARRVKRLMRERFPKTEQRIGSLQLYGIMRALQFRRFRTPNPQVKTGDKV